MKILWIADFGIQHNIGGAQRTDSFMINKGKKLGHSITPFYHDSPDVLLTQQYDMVVSGNLEALHRRPNVFQFIVSHPFHVRYEHDSNSYLNARARQELFHSTRKSIFLSEYHRDMFVSLYGEETFRPETFGIATSPIDTITFCDKNYKREDATLYIGFMHPLKGTQNFFNLVFDNPSHQFAIAGWGSPHLERAAKRFPNVRWLGKTDYMDMAMLFNIYKRMFYKPEKFEPFCRSVGEALLCGIEVDCSDNIGAMHDFNKYGPEEFRNRCANSPDTFWRLIDEAA